MWADAQRDGRPGEYRPRWRLWESSVIPFLLPRRKVWLTPVFSASRMQQISDMHSKFALRPCGSMVDIQSPTAENRREKKKKEEERQKPQLQNIMTCPLLWAAIIMAALCNRGAIIFLPCSFYLLSSIFYLLSIFFFLA